MKFQNRFLSELQRVMPQAFRPHFIIRQIGYYVTCCRFSKKFSKLRNCSRRRLQLNGSEHILKTRNSRESSSEVHDTCKSRQNFKISSLFSWRFSADRL